MKILSLLLAAMLFFNLFGLSSVSWAQSAASGLFADANELYRRGEYEEARNKYLQITADGVRDARLFYNLGNASFKESRLGDAIVWYERAIQLDPRDDAAVQVDAQRGAGDREADQQARSRQGRHRDVRGHQEAGPGGDRRAGDPRRHALRQPALAGRHAHQLHDRAPADQPPQGARRGRLRCQV